MMEHQISPQYQDFLAQQLVQQQFFGATDANGNFAKQPRRQVLGRTHSQWQQHDFQQPNQLYPQQQRQMTDGHFFPQSRSAEIQPVFRKSHTLPPRSRPTSVPMYSRSLSEGNSAVHTQMTNLNISASQSEEVIPPTDDSQSLGLVGKSVAKSTARPLSTLDEEADSDSDPADTHPNKFAIAIEEHTNRLCCYKRQPVRSGPQVKVVKKSGEVYSPIGPSETSEVEQDLTRRYYRKDLVRVCVCGKYDTKEALLENRGRDNDADGYEVHYNIKCKWKSYEDFKTKKRVIIRLCKCYKPSF